MDVRFKLGNEYGFNVSSSNLPSGANIVPGAYYQCVDTHKLYLGLRGTGSPEDPATRSLLLVTMIFRDHTGDDTSLKTAQGSNNACTGANSLIATSEETTVSGTYVFSASNHGSKINSGTHYSSFLSTEYCESVIAPTWHDDVNIKFNAAIASCKSYFGAGYNPDLGGITQCSLLAATQDSRIASSNSAIIGGNSNNSLVENVIILGGNNITADRPDTVYMHDLMLINKDYGSKKSLITVNANAFDILQTFVTPLYPGTLLAQRHNTKPSAMGDVFSAMPEDTGYWRHLFEYTPTTNDYYIMSICQPDITTPGQCSSAENLVVGDWYVIKDEPFNSSLAPANYHFVEATQSGDKVLLHSPTFTPNITTEYNDNTRQYDWEITDSQPTHNYYVYKSSKYIDSSLIKIDNNTITLNANNQLVARDTTYTGSGNISINSATHVITTSAEENQNAFSKLKVGNVEINAASKTDTIEFEAGLNVTLTPDSASNPKKITINATDTTYESKSEVSSGTDLSLVTTGEKYVWNNKQNAITSSNKLSASFVSGLATVATSGSYNDLSDKPTIPDLSGKVDKAGDTMTGDLTMDGCDIKIQQGCSIDFNNTKIGLDTNGYVWFGNYFYLVGDKMNSYSTGKFYHDGHVLAQLDQVVQIANNLSDLSNRQTSLNNLTDSAYGTEGQMLMVDEHGNAGFDTFYAVEIVDMTV